MSKKEPHLYLRMHPYHRSVSDAEALVLGLLHKISPGFTNQHWKRQKEIQVKLDNHEIAKKSFGAFVMEARKTGTVRSLRWPRDQKDPFLGGRHSIAVTENMNPGIAWGGYKSELVGPASYQLIELEFTEDILHYREVACQRSALEQFSALGRAYRAYLFSCISLVEAFLNVDVAFRKFAGTLSEDDSSKWIRSSLEHRVETWAARNCSSGAMDSIKQTDAWRDFKELRVARNAVTHSADPFFGISVKVLHQNLNLVREGVGGLLRLLRKHQGLEMLGFIERLESAPVISFVSALRRSK